MSVSSPVADQTSGSSGDWEKSLGVKYAFAPELRGDWFEVDPAEINKSLQEFSAGVIKMAEAIEEVEGAK